MKPKYSLLRPNESRVDLIVIVVYKKIKINSYKTNCCIFTNNQLKSL